MADEKEIRIDAKLKNRAEKDPQFAEEMWAMRNPGEDGEKLSLEAITALLPDAYGITCALSTVSEFYKWLRMQRRIDAALKRSEQARYEMAKDPSVTQEDLDRVGQLVFTAETIEGGDVKAFVELAKLRALKKRMEMDERKISAASKTKIEDGLEALFTEIKGNKKAEALFKQLQEVVKAA